MGYIREDLGYVVVSSSERHQRIAWLAYELYKSRLQYESPFGDQLTDWLSAELALDEQSLLAEPDEVDQPTEPD